MSDAIEEEFITVDALQTRLSELQTLWQTAKRREISASTSSKEGEKERVEDEGLVTAATTSGGIPQPTKPTSPPLRSPRPYHPRAPSLEAVLTLASTNGLRESMSSMAMLYPPHTPSAPSTGTPRVRHSVALQAPLVTTATTASTADRASVESITLPPLQAHVPSVLTCPHCNAKVASVASRYCSQCGVQLSAG
ncbi:hypothetical protein N2W54_007320 [Lotmaria passim]